VSDERFWSRVLGAVGLRRDAARWENQKRRVLDAIEPHRPSRKLKWVVLAAPAFAAAAFIAHRAVRPPAQRPEPAIVKAPPPSEARTVETPSVPSEETAWDARVTAVEGEVLLTDSSGESSLLEADSPVEAGDLVDVPSDGRVEIALADDSVMEFGGGSRFTVGSIEKKDSFFDLAYGLVVAKLNWSKRFGYRLRIRSPNAVAAVRGTEFAVEVDEAGETDIGVFDEGRVGVSGRSREDAGESMLSPGQEIRFGRDASETRRPRVRKMERLAKHRGRVRHMNGRQKFLKQNWKRMPKQRRMEMRRKGFQRAMRDPKTREAVKRRKAQSRGRFRGRKGARGGVKGSGGRNPRKSGLRQGERRGGSRQRGRQGGRKSGREGGVRQGGRQGGARQGGRQGGREGGARQDGRQGGREGGVRRGGRQEGRRSGRESGMRQGGRESGRQGGMRQNGERGSRKEGSGTRRRSGGRSGGGMRRPSGGRQRGGSRRRGGGRRSGSRRR
jgi:hypothetical protein